MFRKSYPQIEGRFLSAYELVFRIERSNDQGTLVATCVAFAFDEKVAPVSFKY